MIGRRIDASGLLDRATGGEVVRHLTQGGLVVHPTQTVYGIGGSIEPGPLDRLGSLKARSDGRPFLLLIHDPEAVPGLAWTEAARRLARRFWPGPLTLVLEDPQRRYPAAVRGPGGVAVRVEAHPVTAQVLRAFAAPLTSTSANRPGDPPAPSAEEARTALESLGAGPETWLLDAGGLNPSPPSSIVDCTRDLPTVVREGSIPAAELLGAVESPMSERMQR